MEKQEPEETKANIFPENDPNSAMEEEDKDNEMYSSLEEYFLDCCRDGFQIPIFFPKVICNFRDIAEVRDCIENNVDIFWMDHNLNNAMRFL